jgi:L-amino acid N-acyltransferase YncA
MSWAVRGAAIADLDAIRHIYNEGIEDRIATLDDAPKSVEDILAWWSEHVDRYAVVVAHDQAGHLAGWAALNPYSRRRAYRGVADLSIYVARAARGKGVGSALLAEVEERARDAHFHKIVLFTFAINDAARALYRKFGYRDVGIFFEQGRLDGRFIDVLAMEKILAA